MSSMFVSYFQMGARAVMAELQFTLATLQNPCMLRLSLQDRLFAVTAGKAVCCHSGERVVCKDLPFHVLTKSTATP